MLNGARNVIIQNVHITELNPQYIWGGCNSLDGTNNVWIDHVKLLARVTSTGPTTPATHLTWEKAQTLSSRASNVCDGVDIPLQDGSAGAAFAIDSSDQSGCNTVMGRVCVAKTLVNSGELAAADERFSPAG
ncbi:uncharacterized protein NFIA_023100 [Aspergillus fischeri NRRL 181]|uniref:Uncharacterized protein n=1 Tax=Neosartorya fischeri (strain ATCC 1020 / DSM 3700 / CBS 544.65 / FGSC A1164 / JCM 1740 / NRRL 181 / WB 181) TaxID=331117 RepID=A1D5A6_NEOFI|nr:uncharacterized protein NFIA_023100 [Aspergillus fischeri NRRL 181]EAW23599.1 hypothetical protein NFIA_023100 [Aspergillus fischeri NRRL 181]